NDSLSAAGVWHLTNPLDFKWVRIALKTNNMTPLAADGDSSHSNQVCWDGTHQIILPNGYGPTCTRYGSVVLISVTSSGANYTSAPSVNIAAPPSGGIQATAHANMILVSDQEVHAVTTTTGGSGYTSAPTISFSGGGGTGATAHVCTSSASCAHPFIPLNGAPVGTITLTAPGTRCYATAPAVAFSGGGGTGAAVAVTLASANSCIQSLTVN